MSADLREAALRQAALGRPVFPCDPQTKAPLVRHGFKQATTDARAVADWWDQFPTAMIGMPTGPASGVWVLDVDDPALFEANCPIELPATRKATTGKGYHLYWLWTAEVRSRAKAKGRWPYPVLPGAETRGIGGYVILPPSIHPSGRTYQWGSIAAAMPAPASLLAIVQTIGGRQAKPAPAAAGEDTPYGLAALARECEAVRHAPDGSQESTLSWAAYRMGRLVAEGRLSSTTARNDLTRAGLAMVSHDPNNPWRPCMVKDKIADRLRAGMGAGR